MNKYKIYVEDDGEIRHLDSAPVPADGCVVYEDHEFSNIVESIQFVKTNGKFGEWYMAQGFTLEEYITELAYQGSDMLMKRPVPCIFWNEDCKRYVVIETNNLHDKNLAGLVYTHLFSSKMNRKYIHNICKLLNYRGCGIGMDEVEKYLHGIPSRLISDLVWELLK